ncbi:tetratricopeptide repeat protein [Amycolatopsis sp. CA-161197]|uniref:tetratricopeptide repeat protein n=1 Tax=Amycolatopsis sp. CA-161197 TaxID=3239922 RepID=UPI003D8E8B4E
MRDESVFAMTARRLCREKGLTLKEIASQAGYSESYVSKVFHGHRDRRQAVVNRLDEVLGAHGELVRIASEQRLGGDHVRPMQLPPPASDFTGRQGYLRQLDDAVAAHNEDGTAVTVLIEGGFWAGKTELAIQWASQVQERYPGGCLFVDLHGLAAGKPAEPGAVLDGFLRALGAPGAELTGTVEERAARYRSRLSSRPSIVILDNAADYKQVRPLLPGAGSVLIVTSREHQGALLTHTGAVQINLPPLPVDDAMTLLRCRVGEARVNADLRAAEKIVRCAGRLPMAIRIAAEYTKHGGHTLDHVAGQLATMPERLALFTSSDPAVNIRAVLDVSYLALPSQAARVFRLLGTSPTAVISPESTAALGEINVAEAGRALDVLHRAHLVELVENGRMRMNHLLRAYAHERAGADEPPRELDKARHRLLHWYAATTHAASNALAPDWAGAGLAPDSVEDVVPLSFGRKDYDAALTWFEIEAGAILWVARSVAVGDLGWKLPAMLLPYFYITKNWRAWLNAATDGRAAALRVNSRAGHARSMLSLGWVRHEVGHTEDAILLLQAGLRQQGELGTDDRDGLLEAWTAFALASAHASLRQADDARELYARAEQLFSEGGLDFGVAVSKAMLACEQQQFGEDERAAETAYDALELAERSGINSAISLAHHQLGLLLLQQGSYRPALTHLDKALELRRTSRERWAEADTLTVRAEVLSKLGHDRNAREAYREAAEILETLHDPRAFDIQAQIASLNAVLNAPDTPAA